MSRPDDQWVILGQQYLQATAGSFLSGVTHNLNNAVHIVDLQLELLQRKLAGALDRGQIESRLERMGQASKSMGEQLQHLRHRFFYTQVESTQIDLGQYMEWLDAFWNNNLFYKHNISMTWQVAEEVPNLELRPFFLTLCLEEPLKNAVRACRAANLEGEHTIRVQITPWNSGAAVTLDSREPLPDTLDIWAEGTTSSPGRRGLGLPLVQALGRIAGWETALFPNEDTGARFELKIPEMISSLPSIEVFEALADW